MFKIFCATSVLGEAGDATLGFTLGFRVWSLGWFTLGFRVYLGFRVGFGMVGFGGSAEPPLPPFRESLDA